MTSGSSTRPPHVLGRNLARILASRRGIDHGELTENVEPTLERLLENARAAWPDIALEPSSFVAYVAERIDANVAAGELASALDQVHAGDLYLACACVQNDARALTHFDQSFLLPAREYLARRNPTMRADDLHQALRERLLLPAKDGRPRLTGYAGQGPLGGWVRVVAARVLIDLRRGEQGDVELDVERLGVHAQVPDPENAIMKAHDGALLRGAFQRALGGLEASERALLALHYVDGMSTDAIGALYRVNGSTIRRRVAKAREDVLHTTRTLLREELKLRPADLDSVLRMMESQLDVSLSRLLKKG